VRNPVLFLLIIFGASCGNSSRPINVKNVKRGICDCTIPEDEIQPCFIISSVGDSVVICKPGKFVSIGGGTVTRPEILVDFLKLHSLAQQGKIIDCKTNRDIKIKYYNYALSYKNKSLNVESQKEFDIYNKKLKTWRYGTLIPPLYATTTINLVHKMFDDQVRENRKSLPNYDLIRRLLGAALSGDKLSGERLVNYDKYFDITNDNKSLLNDNINVLKDFEAANHF
jgi:hypothetical protein